MNLTSTSVHNVVRMTVTPVQYAEGHRWQLVTLYMEDGSMHEIVAHLTSDFKGLPTTDLPSNIGVEKFPVDDIGGYR